MSKIVKTKPQNQIIHFTSGYKRTIMNIVRVWENEAVHILTQEGIEWIVYKDKVDCIEIEYITNEI